MCPTRFIKIMQHHGGPVSTKSWQSTGTLVAKLELTTGDGDEFENCRAILMQKSHMLKNMERLPLNKTKKQFQRM
jgi:hypothetical protein